MTERNLKMVGIVKGVEQVLVERMDILKPRKAVQDRGKLLGESLLCKLDLSGVESWNMVSESAGEGAGRIPPRILLIWKPARIWVGSFLWVRLSTISRNSC